MDLDSHLLFNFLPLFGAFFTTVIACAIVFQKLKLRWPVTVNCWFCNTNTKVCRQEKHWWLCPSCHQYNGFSKDGDYVYDIPEQYDVSLNNSKVSSSYEKNVPSKAFENGLCQECNNKEKLKVSKLNSFEPTSDKRYDSEVQNLKNFLEKKYPLCVACKLKVRNVLYEQALWLSRYKLLSFTQKPIRVIIQNGQKVERIARFIQTVLASGVAYNTDYWLLPISGFFLQLCSHFISSKKATVSNTLTMLLWICLFTLVLPKGTITKPDFVSLNWFTLEETTKYHTIVIFASFICLMNLRPLTSANRPRSPVMLKKLNNTREKNILPESGISDNKPNNHKKEIQTEITCRQKIPEKAVNSPRTPFIVKLTSSESTIPVKNSSMENESFTSWRGSFVKNSGINNSLYDLSSLSLSNNSPRSMSKTVKMFEKKTYGTTSPDLFAKITNVTARSRHHILAPPKLKSVTQTSWVAGGYWQEGMAVPSLSRSSSQSSGFDSAGSNFNPSKEPSVYDFDRCSVASDATLSCSASWRNSPNSLKSFDRHCPSPCSFVKPQVFPRGQNCQLPPTYSCFQQHAMMPHSCSGKSLFGGQCSHHPNEFASAPVKSHAPLSLSYAWLPTLLCSSLVVNIVVLCITLSR